MKLTIDGVRYNTENDTLIATNKPPAGQLGYPVDTEISLYRTLFNRYYVYMCYSIADNDRAILPIDKVRARIFYKLMTYAQMTAKEAFRD